MCYLGTFMDAKAHEGENTKIGIKNFAGLEFNLAVGAEQFIHSFDKIGIKVQESVIEHVVEFLTLLFYKFAGFCHTVEVVDLAGR